MTTKQWGKPDKPEEEVEVQDEPEEETVAKPPVVVGILHFLGGLELALSLIVGVVYILTQKNGELVGIVIAIQGVFVGSALFTISYAAQWAWDIRALLMKKEGLDSSLEPTSDAEEPDDTSEARGSKP